MNKKEIIEKLQNKVEKRINGDSDEEFSEKLESMITLKMLKDPSYILGCELEEENDVSYMLGDFKYYPLLSNSKLFVETMYTFKSDFKNLPLYQLKRLKCLFDQIYHSVKPNDNREFVFEIILELEELIYDLTGAISSNIEGETSKYLSKKPKLFFAYLRKIYIGDFVSILINNEFIEALDNLLLNNYEFTEDELVELEKILELNIKLYEFDENDETFTLMRDERLEMYIYDILIGQIPEEEFIDFNIELCMNILKKIERLIDTGNEMKLEL